MMLLDDEGRIFLYRTTALPWLKERSAAFHKACDGLLLDTLQSKAIEAQNAANTRGPHFPCVLGHYRQYSAVSLMFLILVQANACSAIGPYIHPVA